MSSELCFTKLKGNEQKKPLPPRPEAPFCSALFSIKFRQDGNFYNGAVFIKAYQEVGATEAGH